MSQPAAVLLSVGVVIATLLPVLREDPLHQDSYPLSTYPMFARTVDKRRLVFAEGVAKNRNLRLGPKYVANDEPMQANRTLLRAAREGEEALRLLCGRIAERVSQDAELGDVKRVRITAGLFDPIHYFMVDDEPEQIEVLGECRVRRSR